MPTTLQFRRGNTTQNNAFTGAAGELSVDTTTKTLRIHDGSTAGGEGVVGLTATQTLTNKTLTSPTINGGTFSGTFTGTISPGAITTNSITSNGSNADLSIQPSGTGDIILSALRVNGTTLDSSDSSKITIAEALDVTGALTASGLAFPTSDGSADQFLKTDGSGNLSFADLSLGDLTITGSTISTPSNADLTLSPGGTGGVVASAIKISGTTLSSADSTIININENTIVDGTLTVSGALASSTSLALASGATVTGIADEDNMSSDSNTLLATQQSIKAYVDAQITAEDLDFQADSGGALSIDLDSETMTFTGGTGIDTSGSGNAVTFAIDSTVATLTGSQTLTNKVLTSPTISTPTVTGAMTATSVTTNDITTNGSNADLDVSPQGTGKVQFYGAYTFPTSDGSNGNALVTDGSGALSFGTVGDPSASDLTDAVARKDKRLYINRARAIDKFDVTFCDSVLYYVCTNDYKNDIVNIQKLSVVHNNSTAFISGSGINNSDDIDMPVFTADVSGDLVVVKGEMTSDDSSIDAIGGSTTFLKLPLGDNSSAGTSGNTQLIVNSDVDSASEAFDTFAHATFRGAKYFFSVNSDTKTELENIEVLVVHDGSDAYMTQYAGVRTGNDPLMTVTAAISGSNVVVSVAGLEPNLRVTANIIRLKDTMVSDSGSFANTEAIAPTTISSTATAIVDLDTVSKGNGAVIYVVGKNATEDAFSISEVFMAVSGSGDISISSPGHVSTKSTDQLEFSTGFKDDEEATAQLFASSTSGGSTTCSAYRINLLAN